MNILTSLVVIPALTILLLIFTKSYKQARVVAVIGTGIEFIASLFLLYMFFDARKSGMTDEFLFREDFVWFKSLNIHYNVAIDGIGVLMILLNAIITFAGIFASWEVKDLAKEFLSF